MEWHGKRDGQWMEGIPAGNMRFVEKWLLRQKQQVEEYRPDIMYLDHHGIPFGEIGLEAVAHYYNQALEWHGATDVVITAGLLGDYEQRALVSNVERGFVDATRERPWQTATCIGNWHYSRPIYERSSYKSAKQVVQRLADVVSKNGNLLLSVPVRGDGTIDEKEEAIVDDIAWWNATNGEAIFGTRPWHSYGEGPTQPKAGEKAEDQTKPFTAEDIRFTRKGETLYAILLDWPERKTSIRSLGTKALAGAVIERIDLLGGPELQFRRDADALRLTLPPAAAGAFVPALRILGCGLTDA